jgi:hypothetical protein
MKFAQRVLGKLDGLYYPQEYLCLAKELFQDPLNIYIVDNDRVTKDITNHLSFTGYSPLILSLHLPANEFTPTSTLVIRFSAQALQPNDMLKEKDALACLSLQLFQQQRVDDRIIAHYEGKHGSHRFLSSFHQKIISLNNRLHKKKPGNVFLHNNLYKQVQIAYAIPRIISLITVTDGRGYNLFPTDLHGPVNDNWYLSSLRHGGKACQQVLNAKKIAMCTIHYTSCKKVFALGKNHMQEMKPKESFPYGTHSSNLFKLPLPESVLKYRELEVVDHFQLGIHKLLLYKIVSENSIIKEPATLAHIHNVYATWRHSNGLAGNYLLR